MSATRLVTIDDAPALAELYSANREFLAPYEPVRDDAFYTVGGQRAVVEGALARHAEGTAVPCVILDDTGTVAGRINLSDVVRGAFQSGSLGYWVSAAANGRGLATRAVREIAAIAFSALGLHRIQAATLLDNVRSQRVLERNGFARIGMAPAYLNIAGRWQDHFLYQLLAGDGCRHP